MRPLCKVEKMHPVKVPILIAAACGAALAVPVAWAVAKQIE